MHFTILQISQVDMLKKEFLKRNKKAYYIDIAVNYSQIKRMH